MDKKRKKILKSLKDLRNSNLDLSINNNFTDTEANKRIIQTDSISYDYSKQRVNQEILNYLLTIPDQLNLKDSIESLSLGKFLNPTENKGVSHMLYRNIKAPQRNKIIKTEEKKIRTFINQFSTKKSHIKDVICIGIGGSRTGPEFLSEFLYEGLNKVNLHFCSSYDLLELQTAIKQCRPDQTLVFVASKSFKTDEIIENMNYVNLWLEEALGVNHKDNLYGISSNLAAMQEFGIKEENQFHILDSLGGRFSIWSPISLPSFINSGEEEYREFLKGAWEADKNFLKSSWDKNIPVLMSLLSFWNTNGLSINNLGIFTYNYRLRSLTKYLAQLGMESNGKTFNFNNKKSLFRTSPLIWGGYGPEAQHSVFQWLMQGTESSACDFIGVNIKNKELKASQEMLLAQVISLTLGEYSKDEKYKTIEGNNPTSILQLNNLSTRSIGFLIAVYEHKAFVDSLIFGIDAFDQWGVQLGKDLMRKSRERDGFLNKYFHKDLLPKS